MFHRLILVAALIAQPLFVAAAPDPGGPGAHAGASGYSEPEAFAFSQAAIGRRVDNYALTDSDGDRVALADFHGRPVVISLIFTSCHHTCPVITQSLGRAANIGWQALGDDSFSLLTIGFDTRVDTPERMAAYARKYRVGEAHWHFLSAEADTMTGLARDLGFLFFPSPRGFDHLAQTTILDADGKVYTQVYGDTVETPALVEPLKQLVFGTRADAGLFENWVSGIRLFCTVYDPKSGRYRFDYSPFIGAGIALFSFIVVMWFVIRSRRGGDTAGI